MPCEDSIVTRADYGKSFATGWNPVVLLPQY